MHISDFFPLHRTLRHGFSAPSTKRFNAVISSGGKASFERERERENGKVHVHIPYRLTLSARGETEKVKIISSPGNRVAPFAVACHHQIANSAAS